MTRRPPPSPLEGLFATWLLLALMAFLVVVSCAREARSVPLERQALSAMLSLATPGVAPCSRIELAECAASCVESMTELVGVAPVQDYRRGRISYPGWSRVETEAEGMVRYAVIARALERVAADPPPAWSPNWPRIGLVRGLVTIARHESAFWRPVHEGRLRGMAGEVCLVQIHPAAAAALGIDLESLVGIDEAATERCLRAGAEVLARSRWSCDDGTAPWFERAIGAYASGEGCFPASRWAQVIESRTETWAITATRRALPLLAELALERTEPTLEVPYDWAAITSVHPGS